MAEIIEFPVIDLAATGKKIQQLREDCGFTVRELQRFFGFEEPAAIYHWQNGKNLPTVDNLCALSKIFGVPMDDIIVLRDTADVDSKKRLITAIKKKSVRKLLLFWAA